VIGKMADSETKIRLETTLGDIVIQLYEKEMPVTTANFKELVQKGFYDGVTFHRVIEGFMIQGGDPTGTGRGGPGYQIKDEFTESELDANNRGTISMANAGPNTGGSQFFINLVDNNFLDGRHPVFGKVAEGMEVVDAIGDAETDSQDKPLEVVKIIKATIV
jgi:peptidylprolyl isomerase